jgi:hypothetical protein
MAHSAGTGWRPGSRRDTQPEPHRAHAVADPEPHTATAAESGAVADSSQSDTYPDPHANAHPYATGHANADTLADHRRLIW